MNAPPALQTLLDHASAQRDNALAAHRRALVALQGAQAQAEQLVAHRRDTMERAGPRAQQPASLLVMQSYQGFIARLDEAVRQQQLRVDAARARKQQAEAALLAAEQRVASVRKLIEGRMAEAELAFAKREQKGSDEFASRMAWGRGAASSAGFGAPLLGGALQGMEIGA
ncbi:MAG TPA: flagellar export protein FliJ [Methylibium sp.]|uniref:flagellar export protein FliJ n=1 Tax=Methylibium sp. TaxID=2067992 RepID=UPI002DB85EED|nr:flagellar export protein FliJ [Methylibium sp.]HEU4458610.1 flagellar export protein FliJ [Methylibium sp.]